MNTIYQNQKLVSENKANQVMLEILDTFIQRIGDPITIFGFQDNQNEEIVFHGYIKGSVLIGDPVSSEILISFSMKDGSLYYFRIDTKIVELKSTFQIDEMNFYFHVINIYEELITNVEPTTHRIIKY